jgi:urease subunit alpha
LIIKGGFITHGAMGDPNASIPTPQPVHYRPMFGAVARGDTRVPDLRLASRAERASKTTSDWPNAERGEQHPRRAQAAHGAQRLPRTEIDRKPTRCADDQLLTCEPATSLPLAQRYFLF